MLITSPRGQAMLSYLPSFYAASAVIAALFQAEGSEFDAVRDAASEVLNQTYVNTATWALDKWESELGLPTNTSLTDDQRRQRILGQLRGYGTATKTVIQNIVNAYEGGDVEVIEDIPHYSIEINFVSTAQEPSNFADLQTILRKVIPAHLDIQYVFDFLTWDKLDAKVLSWDALDALNLTWDELPSLT